MSAIISLDPAALPEETHTLRQEVRDFLAREADTGSFDPNQPGASGRFSPDFRPIVVRRSVGSRPGPPSGVESHMWAFSGSVR